MKSWLEFLGVFFLLFFLIPNVSLATDTIKTKTSIPDTVRQFGIFLSYNYNDHNPNFSKLPGIPNCCQGFTNGSGKGLSFALFIEMPLPYSLFGGLRTSFSKLDGWLKEWEQTFIRDGNQIIEGIFEHNLKANIFTFGFEPYVRYYFNFHENLSIFLGGRVAFPFVKNFEQWEQIVEPKDRGIFVDTQSRTRNKYSGDIPKAKPVQTDLHFGLCYDLPINKQKSIILSPFASYHIGLTDVADSIIWKINSFRVGISLKYLPIKIEKPKIEPPKIEYEQKIRFDTIIVENEKVQKTHFATGVEKIDTIITRQDNKIVYNINITRRDTIFRKPKPVANIQINTGTIYLETQFVTQAFPLLPIVFFEFNSDEILDFYKKISKPEEFNYDSLPTKPLELNKQILNIVGYRLKQKPGSKITVVGYTDSTTEKANCELALRRANSIKKYLVEVWKIEPNRINVQTGKEKCYPKNRTITQNDSGFAENRRILITSTDPEILQPIAKRRFLEVLDFKPKILQFNPNNSKLFGIKNWKLEVLAQNNPVLSYSGQGNPFEITENVQEKLIDLLKQNYTLEVLFKLEDIEGNISVDQKTINIINDTNEVEIQRLSLILFDVSSAEIPTNTKNEIKKFLTVNSELTQARIIGYSDILGDQDFNYSLSQKRAEKTLELVKSFDPNIEIIEMKGVGSSTFPPGIFSYSTPAERFLSRTVYIELIKKWK
ncbi:MAG: OmpA family protein [Ignavibacteria bacterium]|nr:OmpA family protein [Ignavibacteria bacterium]